MKNLGQRAREYGFKRHFVLAGSAYTTINSKEPDCGILCAWVWRRKGKNYLDWAVKQWLENNAIGFDKLNNVTGERG